MTHLKMISWNVRGLGKSEKVRAVARLVTRVKPTFLLLQETKLNKFQNGFWRKLGGKFKASNFDCVIINVYGPAVEADKEVFFRELSSFVHTLELPVCVGGDFNAYLDPEEKIGVAQNWHFVDIFNAFNFPKAIQKLLPKSLSDHNPLLLEEDCTEWGPKPFRFFNYLLEEDGFDGVIRNSIFNLKTENGRRGLLSILQGTKKAIKNCPNSNHKGFSEEISVVETRIHELELRSQGGGISAQDREQLLRWRNDLWNLHRKEESIWLQKSRQKWITNGDRNTRFFHLCTLNRSRVNAISSLKVAGVEITDPDQIRAAISYFFKRSYNDKSTL
ncbi:uncharacterized protein LOC120170218 [Hibiscus syriacus]|uniref:uncharacterized protein LOC120170218 n=1 Tax=Hibiscus syriacus TaxID=106335 RepID=UPI00192423E1|nr:uncharacterized protein LOC120170218 [Hibiscus syriacus]